MKSSDLVFLAAFFLFVSCQTQKEIYVCKPCDLPCDKLTFHAPGTCQHCKMTLIKKSELIVEKELMVNDIAIVNGSGKFLVEGGIQKNKTILIHYYKPENLKSNSPVLFVLPGAGRNGDDYRDAWIEISQKYNVLILSPEYAEEHYPGFWSYNLAGMIYNINADDQTFDISKQPKEWIFQDFDRIFNQVKKSQSLETDTYDMFGHSAGGQILHRLAIFKPKSKANRMLAANSGWYTIPSESKKFPNGISESNLRNQDVDFSSNLVVFLGQEDNANETRGHLRHSPEADEQGLHRLERGKYFYNTSKIIAKELNTNFNWELEIIPNIGHDYIRMSQAAGHYLYN